MKRRVEIDEFVGKLAAQRDKIKARRSSSRVEARQQPLPRMARFLSSSSESGGGLSSPVREVAQHHSPPPAPRKRARRSPQHPPRPPAAADRPRRAAHVAEPPPPPPPPPPAPASPAPVQVLVKYPDGLLLHVFEAARFSDATFGEAVEAFGLLFGAKKDKLERRQAHALATREE